MNGIFPGLGGLDPSKMSPQVIAEISDLMRTLTPDQLMKMQTLMHNAMGGHDVNKDMMSFEQSLPPTFREKMARIMYMANGIEVPAQAGTTNAAAANLSAINTTHDEPKDMNEARLVILRSVASGMMPPEQALKILFAQ